MLIILRTAAELTSTTNLTAELLSGVKPGKNVQCIYVSRKYDIFIHINGDESADKYSEMSASFSAHHKLTKFTTIVNNAYRWQC